MQPELTHDSMCFMAKAMTFVFTCCLVASLPCSLAASLIDLVALFARCLSHTPCSLVALFLLPLINLYIFMKLDAVKILYEESFVPADHWRFPAVRM